ncbi:ATP-dependent DNA helicase [Trametopsis cervina]|nr:ATP-dependent DNA helicase [Trametopsis cervina]
MEKAYEVLKSTFGFDDFRLSQKEVINRLVVENENALVLFPTGGGKSLTYQIPALCLEGLTLVISPLIALMKDQVDALVERGVKAASLDSTQDMGRATWVKDEVLNESMKILYVAPERLNNESFVAMMRQVKISLLAIDESHCISQWGASFRPEYLKVARFAEEMDVERVLCLTATATQSVAQDICKSFFIDPQNGVFRTPVYRPNLSLQVQVADSLQQKLNAIVPILQSRTGPAIVYVTLQKQAEEVADKLRSWDIESFVYHAGLPSEKRTEVQVQFMKSEKGVVCATIAFGMGIDKSNIRQVIHLTMPKTLENYSQEVGRAGRDGLPSTCLVFLSAPDIPVLEGFVRGDTCAKKDMELWLQEVATKAPASDNTIDFNVYQQGKTYDIRSNVLNLCYAQLELDYGYIRAVTPYYSVYDVTIRTDAAQQKVFADDTYYAKLVRQYWRRKNTGGYHIDVAESAQHANVERQELTRKISEWEVTGLITTKPSQVRNRFAVLKPLPKDVPGIKDLAELMYARMLAREDEGVQKLKQVIEFASNDDCLAHNLASYFGDFDAVPDGMCQRCTFCTTGTGADFKTGGMTSADPHRINAILNACGERDDPRLLARFAFGITSPRLTALKCSTSHPLFGSMGDVDFNTLVEAFDQECKNVGYTSVVTVAAVTTTSRKRTYTQTASSSSSQQVRSTNNYASSSSSSRGRGRGRGAANSGRGGNHYKRVKY